MSISRYQPVVPVGPVMPWVGGGAGQAALVTDKERAWEGGGGRRGKGCNKRDILMIE